MRKLKKVQSIAQIKLKKEEEEQEEEEEEEEADEDSSAENAQSLVLEPVRSNTEKRKSRKLKKGLSARKSVGMGIIVTEHGHGHMPGHDEENYSVMDLEFAPSLEVLPQSQELESDAALSDM